MSADLSPTRRLLFAAVAVLSLAATPALAVQQTSTPTPTAGIEASQVDAAFPQDFSLTFLVVALTMTVGLVLVVRRAQS
ncbi:MULTISPECIES: hypothetical protein [Halorussus]|uniref:hypothetical protein n=1 Tax=Halorussus TaxID=1070314 RepID=UPI00209D4945|nr:hypothetical protein [Halorussus vallis]USZ74843.1 hypothetical protein NGM07_15545 [Halorussus vallis]